MEVVEVGRSIELPELARGVCEVWSLVKVVCWYKMYWRLVSTERVDVVERQSDQW